MKSEYRVCIYCGKKYTDEEAFWNKGNHMCCSKDCTLAYEKATKGE